MLRNTLLRHWRRSGVGSESGGASNVSVLSESFLLVEGKKRSVCPCVRPQVAKATGGHKKNVWEIMNVPNLY